MHFSTTLLAATVIASVVAASRPVVDLGAGLRSVRDTEPALPANPAAPALPANPANPANPSTPSVVRERREMLAKMDAAVNRRDEPQPIVQPAEPAEPAEPAKPAELPVKNRAIPNDEDNLVRRDDSVPASPATPGMPATPGTPANSEGV